MKLLINGIPWTVDVEKETAKAVIHGHSFRINRTQLSFDPDKPFQVWIDGIPASSLWVFEHYATANEAAKFLSSLDPAELQDRVEEAEEKDSLAEAAAELPRFV
jgi:hypothetical protein